RSRRSKPRDSPRSAAGDKRKSGGRAEKNRRSDVASGPTRNRTENLLIKSQLLCQLSYRPGGAAEKSSGPVAEARERLGSPILAPHSSVNLNVSLIGNRSTQSRRARSLSDQITVRCTSTD